MIPPVASSTFCRVPWLMGALIAFACMLVPASVQAITFTRDVGASGQMRVMPGAGYTGVDEFNVIVNPTTGPVAFHISPTSATATSLGFSELTSRFGLSVSQTGTRVNIGAAQGWSTATPYLLYFDPEAASGSVSSNDVYVASDTTPPVISFVSSGVGGGGSGGVSGGSGPTILDTVGPWSWGAPSAVEDIALPSAGLDAAVGLDTASYRIVEYTLSNGTCVGPGVQIGSPVSMTTATVPTPTVAMTHGHCYVLEVTAADRMGNTATVIDPNVVAVDTTPPVLTATLTGPAIRNTKLIEYDVDASDPESGSGSFTVDYELDDVDLWGNACLGAFGSWSIAYPSGWRGTISTPAHLSFTGHNGSCHSLRVTAVSATGTTTIEPVGSVVKIDQEVPLPGTVDMSPPDYQNTTTTSMTLTGVEEYLTDFSVSELVIERGSLLGGACSWAGATRASQPVVAGVNTVSALAHASCYRFYNHVVDLAGNEATSPVSGEVRVDTVAPAGGAIDYARGPYDADQYQVESEADVRVTIGHDDHSTMASRVLEREEGTLDDGVCTWSGSWDFVMNDPGTVVHQTNLEHAHCYRWRYLETDRAGNVATITQNRFIGIDNRPPDIDLDIRDYDSKEHAYFIAQNDLVYYRPTGTDSFYVHIESHAASGTRFARFPIFGGAWTHGGGDEGQRPLQTLYTWTPGALAPGLNQVLVEGQSGLQSSRPFTVAADADAPHDGEIIYDDREISTNSVAIHTVQGTDDLSGLGHTRIMRSEGIYDAGVCRDFGAMITRATDAPDIWVDTTLAGGRCYRYLYVEKDRVGNEKVYLPAGSPTVRVDGASPLAAPVIYASTSPAAYSPGSSTGIIYYNPMLAGSFTAQVNAGSVFSTISSVAFPNLGTGWCCARSYSSAGAVNIYTFQAFASAPAAASVNIVARSGAQTSVAMTGIIADTMAPTPGTITHLTGSQVSRWVNVHITRGSDALSGIDRREIYRQRAALKGANCGTWGAWTLADKDPALAFKDLVPTDDSCYRYKLVQHDHVGNQRTNVSADITRVNADAAATGEVSLDLLSPTQYKPTVSKMFYNPFVAGAVRVHVDTDPTVKSVAFAHAGAGWSRTPVSDSSFPFASRYSYKEKSVSPGKVLATITDRNGRISKASFEFTPDATAPVGGAVKYRTGVSTTASLAIARTLATDTGSGIRTQKLQEQTAAAPSCTSASGWTTLSSPAVAATRIMQPGTCYRYRLLATDRVGNASSWAGEWVKMDTTAPIIGGGHIVARTPLYQYRAAPTSLLYNPDYAGGFEIVIVSQDPESTVTGATLTGLPAKWKYAVRRELSSGWYVLTLVVSYPANAAAPTGPLHAHAVNAAGLSTTFDVSVRPDAAAPAAGGTISYVNGLSPTLLPSISFTPGPGDALSGIGRITLERSVAPYSRSSGCGTWSSYVLLANNPASPFTDKSMHASSCARYRLVEVDRVYNIRIISSTSRVIRDDDTSAPTGFSATLAASATCNAYKVAADGVAVLRWSASSDGQSGIAGYDVYVDGARRLSLAAAARSWTVTGLGAGPHSLYVRARNTDGLVTWATQGPADASIMIDAAAPSIAAVSPQGPVPLVNQTLRTSVSDDTCISTVAFYIDGVFVGSSGPNGALPVAPQAGVHTWYAVATDVIGRTTRSADASFVVESAVTVSAHFEDPSTSPAGGFKLISPTSMIMRGTPGFGGGSFDIVADAQAASGIASLEFPVFVGATGTLTAPGRMHYVFTASGMYAAGSVSVTARSVLGSSASAALKLVTDNEGPRSVTISYPNTYQQSPNVSMSIIHGTDDLSDLVRTRIQMSSAPLDAATHLCGTFSAFAPFVETQLTDVKYVHTSAQLGTCYRYRYIVSDSVGNETIATSPATVRVGAPQAPQLDVSAIASIDDSAFLYYNSGSQTVYYQPQMLKTFVVNAQAFEPLQQVASVTSSSISGFSAPTLSHFATSWSFAYHLPDAGRTAVAVEDLLVTATSGGGAVAVRTLHMHPDVAAPLDGELHYTTGQLPARTNTVTWVNGHDDESGISLRQLQRQQTALTAQGCSPFDEVWTTLATNPAGTSYTDTSIAVNTCYRYRYKELDRVGNVLYDTEDNMAPAYYAVAIPIASLTITPTVNPENIHVVSSGSTSVVYMRPRAGTSFTVQAANDPLISSVQFPDFGPGLTGSTTALTSPWKTTYTAAGFGPVTSAPKLVTIRTLAGGSATSGLTVSLDETAPSAGALKYAAKLQSVGSVAITAQPGQDSQSGLGDWKLQRQSAQLINGECVSEGSWQAIAASNSFVDMTLQHGQCYRYLLTSTDKVGNSSYVLGGWVQVDLTAPDVDPTTLSQVAESEAYTHVASSGTIYINADQAGSFVASIHAADPESGIKAVAWPTLGSGWNSASGGLSAAYTFTELAVQPNIDPAPLAIVTNKAGMSSSASVGNVFLDGADPAGGSINVQTAPVAGHPKMNVVLAADADAGMAEHEIWVQSAPLSANTCGAFSGWQLLQSVSESGDVIDGAAAEGMCYAYRYEATDHVGHRITRTDADIVKVPVGSQVQSTLTLTSNCSCIVITGGGTNAYYKPNATALMTVTVSGDPAITSVEFPQCGGGEDSTAPFAASCTLTTDVSGTHTAFVHKGAVIQELQYTLVQDTQAPVWPANAVTAFQAAGGVRVNISADAVDAGAGLFMYSVRRSLSGTYNAATGSCSSSGGSSSATYLADFAPSQHTYLDTTASSGNCYSYLVYAHDPLGNFSLLFITGVAVA